MHLFPMSILTDGVSCFIYFSHCEPRISYVAQSNSPPIFKSCVCKRLLFFPFIATIIILRFNLHCYFNKESLQSMRAFFLQQRSEEHTSELQSRGHLVCRLLLEKKKK